MRIYGWLSITISLAIFSCAALEPKVEVNDNYFYLNRPEIRVSIGDSLKYIGKFSDTSKKEYSQGYGQSVLESNYYLFLKDNNSSSIVDEGFIILVERIKDSTSEFLDYNKQFLDHCLIKEWKKVGRKRYFRFLKHLRPEQNSINAFSEHGYLLTSDYVILAWHYKSPRRKEHIALIYMKEISVYQEELEQYVRYKTMSEETSKWLDEFVENAEKSFEVIP